MNLFEEEKENKVEYMKNYYLAHKKRNNYLTLFRGSRVIKFISWISP